MPHIKNLMEKKKIKDLVEMMKIKDVDVEGILEVAYYRGHVDGLKESKELAEKAVKEMRI